MHLPNWPTTLVLATSIFNGLNYIFAGAELEKVGPGKKLGTIGRD
jgi:hypothetical protein